MVDWLHITRLTGCILLGWVTAYYTVDWLHITRLTGCILHGWLAAYNSWLVAAYYAVDWLHITRLTGCILQLTGCILRGWLAAYYTDDWLHIMQLTGSILHGWLTAHYTVDWLHITRLTGYILHDWCRYASQAPLHLMVWSTKRGETFTSSSQSVNMWRLRSRHTEGCECALNQSIDPNLCCSSTLRFEICFVVCFTEGYRWQGSSFKILLLNCQGSCFLHNRKHRW